MDLHNQQKGIQTSPISIRGIQGLLDLGRIRSHQEKLKKFYTQCQNMRLFKSDYFLQCVYKGLNLALINKTEKCASIVEPIIDDKEALVPNLLVSY